MTVPVTAVPATTLTACGAGESSAAVRRRVVEVRETQRARNRELPWRKNADLRHWYLPECFALGPKEQRLLERAVVHFELFARAYDRIRRVAHTVADLDEWQP